MNHLRNLAKQLQSSPNLDWTAMDPLGAKSPTTLKLSEVDVTNFFQTCWTIRPELSWTVKACSVSIFILTAFNGNWFWKLVYCQMMLHDSEIFKKSNIVFPKSFIIFSFFPVCFFGIICNCFPQFAIVFHSFAMLLAFMMFFDSASVFLFGIFVIRCELFIIVTSSCEVPTFQSSWPAPKLFQVLMHWISLKQASCSILFNPVQIICWTCRQQMAADWYVWQKYATIVSRAFDDSWFMPGCPVKNVLLEKYEANIFVWLFQFIQARFGLAISCNVQFV